MPTNNPKFPRPDAIRIPERNAQSQSPIASAIKHLSPASAKKDAPKATRTAISRGKTRVNQDAPSRTVASANPSPQVQPQVARDDARSSLDRNIERAVAQAHSGLKIRWLGRVADPDGRNPGHLVEIETLHQTQRLVTIPETLLSRPAELGDLLVAHGARFRTSDAAKRLAGYLRTRPDKPLFIRVADDGWLTLGNREWYAFADEMYSEGHEAARIVRPAGYRHSISGSLDDWLDITGWCAGNPLAIGMLCFGFAAALLQPFGHSSFGVILVGRTSTGKSTILRLVHALSGAPAILPTWEGTANGHEAIAVQHSGKPHVLDELGQADGAALYQLMYRLANGGGRVRATSTGEAARAPRVSTVILSAGEQSPAELFTRRNLEIKPGQLGRFLAIPVRDEFGAFADLHGATSAAEFARQLNEALRKTHGIAWSPYVQYIAENLGNLMATYERRVSAIRESISRECSFDRADGLIHRVLDHFAVACFAGLTAIDAGVLQLEKRDIFAAIRDCFAKWVTEHQAHHETSGEEILEEVRALILDQRNRMPPYSAFSDAGRDTQFGFTHVDHGVNVFLIFPHALQRIAGKHGKKVLDEALKVAGWLIPGSGGRPAKQYKVPEQGNAKVNMYAIRQSSIFGD